MNRFDSNSFHSYTFDKTYSDNMEGRRNVAIGHDVINNRVKRFSVEKDTNILHRQPLHSRDIHKGNEFSSRKTRLGATNTISSELYNHYKKLGNYYNKKGK